MLLFVELFVLLFPLRLLFCFYPLVCALFVFNKDFFCGYSPERINPGDKINTLVNIKKVTSGSNPETANFVDELYASIIKAGTFKASCIKVAKT